jgi:hypothetical protein
MSKLGNHFRHLLVGEESSAGNEESLPKEIRLWLLLMGKKPAKHFKEKCFTF